MRKKRAAAEDACSTGEGGQGEEKEDDGGFENVAMENEGGEGIDEDEEEEEEAERVMRLSWILLSVAFASSFVLVIVWHFVAILQQLPLFTWIGLQGLTTYQWTIRPSLSYVGQGMIMGTKTVLSTLLGALIGWGALAWLVR